MTETEDTTPVPLTRPRFTEEGLTGPETQLQESNDGHAEGVNELVRLKKKPVIPGRATIGMMEQFRRFPWTQDTMLAVGKSDRALMALLR